MQTPGKLLTPGTLVADRFRILDVLGEGGFAVVYLAEQVGGGGLVALKILSRAGARRQAEFEARFREEARVAARIDHPGVASVYDYGVWEQTGDPWIALEWLRGRDLAAELNSRGPLRPSRALARMRELLSVLSVAHRRGIVHKDIKPPNLFLVNVASVAERTTLLDFGIARILSDDALRSTATEELLGTPHYLPPEYIRDLVVSPAFDVYQCGLVFAEMLMGRPVLANLDHAQAMSAHASGRLDLPAVLLDGPLGPIFRRALTQRPTDRYPDAAALAEALKNADTRLPHPLSEAELASLRPVSGAFHRPRPPVARAPRTQTHETLTELLPPQRPSGGTGQGRHQPGPVHAPTPSLPDSVGPRRGAWGGPNTVQLRRDPLAGRFPWWTVIALLAVVS